MKILMIGTGYVGLVSGACFAEMGNDVICVDNNTAKVEGLKKGIIPIYEPGLSAMVLQNLEAGRLQFATSIQEGLAQSDICIIAVGTPMGENGSADLQYVMSVAREIGSNMTRHVYVIDKSTVPVGTADIVRSTIQKELDDRGIELRFDVISNPEFLKEGSAIEDCMKPERIVVGADNEEAFHIMRELYIPFLRNHDRFIAMDIRSAEMTKYVANCMLATKISFMNEMANICEHVGADVNQVRVGIGSDSRIGYSFIYPGCGYGGSCFPKDVEALIRTAGSYGYQARILQAVEEVNQDQKHVLVQKIVRRYGENLAGMTFAVWGLAFKPGTDDMREASSVVLIRELAKRGAHIKAYDPKAMKEAKEHYLKDNSNVEYYSSKYFALEHADALIIVTEWKEFRSPDFEEMDALLKERVIFDGRNLYDAEALKKRGFEYYQIGV